MENKFVPDECICKTCPSFIECREKTGYCVYGRSKCIKEKKGCLCMACPVYNKLKLKGSYFCIAGKDK